MPFARSMTTRRSSADSSWETFSCSRRSSRWRRQRDLDRALHVVGRPRVHVARDPHVRGLRDRRRALGLAHVTSTGPDANSTVSEISARPCASSPSKTTIARSGSSRAISSTASDTDTAKGVDLVPEPLEHVAERAQLLLALVGEQDPQVLLDRRSFVSALLYTSTRPGPDPRRRSTAPQHPGAISFRRTRTGLGSNISWAQARREHIPPNAEGREARTRADRALLERAHRGDQEAREQLVQRFLPLARQLARRYQRGGEALDDLIQVASLGLLKAIDRFDPARTTAFSSFAVPTILGELKRHFRDKGWSVRVPRDLQELAVRLEPTSEALSRELGRVADARRAGRAPRGERRAAARGARGRGRLPGRLARPPARGRRRGRRARRRLRRRGHAASARPRTPRPSST